MPYDQNLTLVKGEQCRRPRFDPWVGKIAWKKAWQPTAVFLPGEFHGQRSLMGYNPWGCKESDTTERLTLSLGRRELENKYPALLSIAPRLLLLLPRDKPSWKPEDDGVKNQGCIQGSQGAERAGEGWRLGRMEIGKAKQEKFHISSFKFSKYRWF